MDQSPRSFVGLYLLQALVKGFSVFYFVLLTVFYAEKLITSTELGYIGAFFIVTLIIGAVVVAHRLHSLNTRTLLQVAAWVAIAASGLLLVGYVLHSTALLIASYGLMGLSTGTAMSGVNAVAAYMTTRGDRYTPLARMGMMTDVVRIVFPLLVAGAVAWGAPVLALYLVIGAAFVFLVIASRQPHIHAAAEPASAAQAQSIRANKPFQFILSLEFLDSFSSSQLFVFLPLIFLAQGYSLESSLLFQTFVFAGYMSGRWLLSFLARRYSGLTALGFAEVGMVLCIVLVLTVKPLWLLYVLSYALGIFARGTSPVIKALAFDSLGHDQIRKGSALHVVAGDSGSALGQFIFGLLVAWYGVTMPFIVSALTAIIIAVLCFTRRTKSAA